MENMSKGRELHSVATLALQPTAGHSLSFIITIVIMTLGWGLFVGPAAESCGRIRLPCLSWLGWYLVGGPCFLFCGFCHRYPWGKMVVFSFLVVDRNVSILKLFLSADGNLMWRGDRHISCLHRVIFFCGFSSAWRKLKFSKRLFFSHHILVIQPDILPSDLRVLLSQCLISRNYNPVLPF